jgi:hypothetical protein
VAGVYTAADDGVLNPQNIQIKPGSIISVARNGGPQGPSLTPLARASDFNVSQIVINDLRMNIKKIMMDDTLPPDNMSARSATEIAERTRELAQARQQRVEREAKEKHEAMLRRKAERDAKKKADAEAAALAAAEQAAAEVTDEAPGKEEETV